MQEEAVRARLDKLIQESGAGYAALSRMIGRNPAYLQQFVKRGVPRRLSESDRHRLATYFKVSESLLGAPESFADTADSSAHSAGTNVSQENPYLLIPYLDPATGKCCPNPPRDALALEPKFAGTLTAGRLSALVAHRVQGDSMMPTLTDGDHILIDSEDSAAPRDGIYGIRTDAGVLVKRISVHPVSRRLSIMSDNGAYPAFPDCDPCAIGIIGRVIWAGRRIA